MTSVCNGAYVKRATILLPDELHERLRREALHAKVSMAQLIRAQLESKSRGKRVSGSLADPLERVEGIIQDGGLSARIDVELYGN